GAPPVSVISEVSGFLSPLSRARALPYYYPSVWYGGGRIYADGFSLTSLIRPTADRRNAQADPTATACCQGCPIARHGRAQPADQPSAAERCSISQGQPRSHSGGAIRAIPLSCPEC